MRVRRALTEAWAFEIPRRQSELVTRAVRVGRDGGVPRDELLVIQHVEHLELDPRLRRAPDRHSVGYGKVDERETLKRLRAALAKEQLLRRGAGIARIAC